MKPFTFSLQAVRTLRQRQEHHALEEFGRCVRARQAAVDQQQLAERRWGAAQDQLSVLQGEGAPVHHLNQLRAHCQAMEQQAGVCRAACARAQHAANEAWERLQDVRRDLELVDKLYLRQREEHDRRLRDEEQKELDEMSNRRWLLRTATAAPTPTACAWN